MYAFLRGILVSASPENVVIDIGGIGYQLFTPCRLYGELPPLGEKVHFFTSFVVRELSHALYGFLKAEERELFDLLMNISGVGPKLALSLIGHLSLHEMQAAISRPDLPTLCKVPGVGKKTAERLIVELKDKLPKIMGEFANFATPLQQDPKTAKIQDAMSALINLGYNQGLAQKAVKQSLKDLPDELELSALITTALQHLKIGI